MILSLVTGHGLLYRTLIFPAIVGDIGDYVKLGILRALAPGYRLGVAWWLYPDENHNEDGRHTGYLNHPERWRHLDPDLFDTIHRIVVSNQRHVGALETAGILPGAIFANEMIPISGLLRGRRLGRQQWFARVKQTVANADLVFLDPDNGLEPAGFRLASAKAEKSITVAELRDLSRPGRCLIVYHHQTRRPGGHHAEIGHWAGRVRNCGLAATVDALRAKPSSPRVFFVLDAPDGVRHRAMQLAERWQGLISWHPDYGAGSAAGEDMSEGHRETDWVKSLEMEHDGDRRHGSLPRGGGIRKQRMSRGTTQVGYVNQHQQEVVRSTGKPGTDHGQYVYVLRCRTCGHEYGANGSDIWLRRCPAHDRGAAGLSI